MSTVVTGVSNLSNIGGSGDLSSSQLRWVLAVTNPIRDFVYEPGEEPREGGQLTKPMIYVLLATAIAILGLNWPIMATGVQSISPIWMGAFRVMGGAAALLVVAAASGNLRIPPRRDLPVIVSLGVFRLAAVSTLVFAALELVPANRSAAVVWTASLWTVPIAAVFLGERVSKQRWVGIALGVVGVVVLFRPWALEWTDPLVVVGHGLLLLAAVINAATAVHIRGHRWTITPLQALPWQLATASVLLVTLGMIREGIPTIDWTPQLAMIVTYQGVLASGVAMWALIVVFRNMETVSANLTLMAIPVVGVISSTLILDEPMTAALAIGLALVLAGVSINLMAEKGAKNKQTRSTEEP